MRFLTLINGLRAITVAAAASTTILDIQAFLKAHPSRQSISSTSPDFIRWQQQDPQTQAKTPQLVKNAFIIQLRVGSDLMKRGQEDAHTQFHKRARDIDYATRHEFKDASIFFGLSIQVSDEKLNETTLADIPNVEKVWPVRYIPRPGPEIPSPAQLRSPVTNHVYNATAGPRADVNSLHRMTQVDRLHARGIRGKGIKIAVVDTGIDYHHPALGGCFGNECRISFGYDFTTNTADPLATCVQGGHGTHVAGTIGMQNSKSSPFGLTGVAPEATLGMYRVFECEGQAPEDLVILALQQAVTDKVDIIGLSLGVPTYWEVDDPFAATTTNLEVLGIIVVAANGNSYVPGLPSSPGTNKGVIAVGSVQNNYFPTVYNLEDSQGKKMRYGGQAWPIAAPASGLAVVSFTNLAENITTPGACDWASWEAVNAVVLDKENSILAIPHSLQCPWNLVLRTAESYGFKYTILYTLDDSDIYDRDFNVILNSPGFYSLTVSAADSKTLLRGIAGAKGSQYKLFFANKEFESQTQLTAGLMSRFSSWGVAADTLSLKPQLAAPGASILSTWPLEGKGYAVLDGTSMATPYVSGALALVKSQFPKASVQELRERLQRTSTTIPYAYNSKLPASAAQQGAGLINVFEAIFTETIVSPTELNLGDLEKLRPQQIKIENKSSRSKTYVITHEPGAGANLWTLAFDESQGPEQTAQFALPATIKFSTTVVTIPAGKSAKFTATVTPPKDYAEKYLPIYSGTIKITGLNEQYKVTYLGQPYSRYHAKYLLNGTDFTGQRTPSLSDDEHVIDDIAAFNLSNPSGRFNFPFLSFMILQPHQNVRVELVPYNTTFVPDYYGYRYTNTNPHGVPASAFPLSSPEMTTTMFAGAEIFGLVESSPYNSNPSISASFIWGNILVGSEQVAIPAGDYRALIRVLRFGGDESKKESWESWLSPIIRIQR